MWQHGCGMSLCEQVRQWLQIVNEAPPLRCARDQCSILSKACKEHPPCCLAVRNDLVSRMIQSAFPGCNACRWPAVLISLLTQHRGWAWQTQALCTHQCLLCIILGAGALCPGRWAQPPYLDYKHGQTKCAGSLDFIACQLAIWDPSSAVIHSMCTC